MFKLIESGGDSRPCHAQLHTIHTYLMIDSMNEYRDEMTVFTAEDNTVMKIDVSSFLVIDLFALYGFKMRVQQVLDIHNLRSTISCSDILVPARRAATPSVLLLC